MLLYNSTTNSEAQTPTYVEVLPSFTHCQRMNTNNTARQEYATLVKFCTLCSELHTGSALKNCQNSTNFKLASLGMRGAQERALLVSDDNIGTYGSSTRV